MLTTTTTMGLRAMGSAAAPCCTSTTRSILRSSNTYSTFCPVGLRGGNNPLILSSSSSSSSSSPCSSSQTPSPKSAATAGGASPSHPAPSMIRGESTMSSSSATPTSGNIGGAAAASAAQSQSQPQEKQPLDWQTFFSLRKSRRRYQVTFSAAGALGFSFGGAMFLSSPGGETLLTYFPLDPFIGFGLGMTGFMALGWLLGPAAGNACFYLRHSKWKGQMTKKEIELFARIKKNRVDPTASSASNPVPDFYGEKIQSISGYRQWLKDQRAFNKKRTTFV